MNLIEAFNNRYYRRPDWDENSKIYYHNGKWFTHDGGEIHKTCVLALMEYNDWEECSNGDGLGVIQGYNTDSGNVG